MKARERLWRSYLGKIGGRKTLREGEETIIRAIIEDAMIAGAVAERNHALGLLQAGKKDCFFPDGVKVITQISSAITALSVETVIKRCNEE